MTFNYCLIKNKCFEMIETDLNHFSFTNKLKINASTLLRSILMTFNDYLIKNKCFEMIKIDLNHFSFTNFIYIRD